MTDNKNRRSTNEETKTLVNYDSGDDDGEQRVNVQEAKDPLPIISKDKNASQSSQTMPSPSRRDNKTLPKLIVFDLDCTLWPFFIDCEISLPCRKGKNDVVEDRRGSHVLPFKDVPAILRRLYEQGVTLGVASRTSEIKGATQLVDLFDWDKYFTHKKIFPGSKTQHFTELSRESGIAFGDMLFFDDEMRNIVDITAMGVTCIHVEDGMNDAVLDKALQKWSDNHK